MRFVRWIAIVLILVGLAGLGVLCLNTSAIEISAHLIQIYVFAGITLTGFVGIIIWGLWQLLQAQIRKK